MTCSSGWPAADLNVAAVDSFSEWQTTIEASVSIVVGGSTADNLPHARDTLGTLADARATWWDEPTGGRAGCGICRGGAAGDAGVGHAGLALRGAMRRQADLDRDFGGDPTAVGVDRAGAA